ncbi:NAD(P)/FAD-dependent oxidoreductase [Cystobacter fuscus]|uniref:flavin-dependent monooxygenase QhpG n=1 Tax=Cystobacter fuscus TaxID=43 RepID=UPI0037C00F22
MTSIRTDVCIIGGGPAGATAAMRLVALGHRVCLLERSVSSQRRPGESLTPGVWSILEILGLRDRVASADFALGKRSQVRWASEHVEQVEQRGHAPGLIVDRARFDNLLLTAAAEQGVHVLRPAVAQRLHRRDGGHELLALQGSEALSIEARFIVDASGRGGFLPGARRPTAPRTLALHAYLHGEKLPDTTRIEAVEDGWYWGTKLPDGTFSVMLFLDPETVSLAGRRGLEALLRSRLAASHLFEACARAELLGDIRARDATAYADAESIGQDFVKLGEAAFAIDPLSSTGVEKAMQTALSGSIAVHTLLERPGSAPVVRSFQEQRQHEAVERHAAWAAGHYRELVRHAESPFWRRRAAPEAQHPARPEAAPNVSDPAALLHVPVMRSEGMRLVELPCIRGDFIEPCRALHHPSLSRAVAFLGDVELAPLLDEVERGGTLLDIVRRWTPRVPMRQGLEIAAWLIANGMLHPRGPPNPGSG